MTDQLVPPTPVADPPASAVQEVLDLGLPSAVEADTEALAEVLCEADELAYANVRADWARESIARTIVESGWLAEYTARVRRETAAHVAETIRDEHNLYVGSCDSQFLDGLHHAARIALQEGEG